MNLKSILDLAKQYEHHLPPVEAKPVPRGADIAGWIDHTLLKPEAVEQQVKQLCQDAIQFNFASICINPIFIPHAMTFMGGVAQVPICTVIGFPLGAVPTAIKVAESELALADGATELDMVISIGMLKQGGFRAVYNDILAVTQTAHTKGALIKVIIENAYLVDFQKIVACLLCKEAGADFVKTSTGFAPTGATVEDVRLMRAVVGSPDEMGVKAAGGIRTYATARAMIEAGATRIGASASIQILQESIQAAA